MIEFSISTKAFNGAYIYVDDGTGTRRWLLPTGIITEDTELASSLYFKSREDGAGFLENWKPAKQWINKGHVQLYAGMNECKALDNSIEHWKQVYLNTLEGDDHVGPETCALCLRSKRIKLITDVACAKCILNEYKETTYADRSVGYFDSCCADYQAYIEEASTENALAMLNTLVELRNEKYGHALYTDFGTIKNVTNKVTSVYHEHGKKIIDDILNAKDQAVIEPVKEPEPEFKIRGQAPDRFYIFRGASSEYLCKDGKLNKLCTYGWYSTKGEAKAILAKYQRTVLRMDEFDVQHLKARAKQGDNSYFAQHRENKKYLCVDGNLHKYCGNGWYSTAKAAENAVKSFTHRALTIGEVEDELGIKVLLTPADVHDALSEPVPEGYGAIKEVKFENRLSSLVTKWKYNAFVIDRMRQYVFKPGDIVLYEGNKKRIIVDLGYQYGPDNKYLGAVDELGRIVATSRVDGPDENFKYTNYKKIDKLIEHKDKSSLLTPVYCPIIAGDVAITPWGDLRFAVDDTKGTGLFTFGGQLHGLIKSNGRNYLPYRKVGRIEDYV